MGSLPLFFSLCSILFLLIKIARILSTTSILRSFLTINPHIHTFRPIHLGDLVCGILLKFA